MEMCEVILPGAGLGCSAGDRFVKDSLVPHERVALTLYFVT